MTTKKKRRDDATQTERQERDQTSGQYVFLPDSHTQYPDVSPGGGWLGCFVAGGTLLLIGALVAAAVWLNR